MAKKEKTAKKKGKEELDKEENQEEERVGFPAIDFKRLLGCGG
ncbi:MAG: hypothetical protein ABJG47_04505 [Ekhidna sp.]